MGKPKTSIFWETSDSRAKWNVLWASWTVHMYSGIYMYMRYLCTVQCHLLSIFPKALLLPTPPKIYQTSAELSSQWSPPRLCFPFFENCIFFFFAFQPLWAQWEWTFPNAIPPTNCSFQTCSEFCFKSSSLKYLGDVWNLEFPNFNVFVFQYFKFTIASQRETKSLNYLENEWLYSKTVIFGHRGTYVGYIWPCSIQVWRLSCVARACAVV